MHTCVFNCLLITPTYMSEGIYNLKYLTTPMITPPLPHLFFFCLTLPGQCQLLFPSAQTTILEVILDFFLFTPNIPSVSKSCQLQLQYVCRIIKLHHLHCSSLIQVPSFLAELQELPLSSSPVSS